MLDKLTFHVVSIINGMIKLVSLKDDHLMFYVTFVIAVLSN